MDEILMSVNWIAVLVGAAAAFALGIAWFGPLFGKTWSAGSHGLQPPARFPVFPTAVQAVGTFLLSWVIGATATIDALFTAVFLILAIAALQLSGSLYSQKSPKAALIDASYVIAMGVLMIAAQGIF
jgi:hypothetical protein